MDPIRPIGPPERDLEPILRVTRSSPDARRERPDSREDGQPDEQPRRRPDEQPSAPPDDEGGTSLIDVRV